MNGKEVKDFNSFLGSVGESRRGEELTLAVKREDRNNGEDEARFRAARTMMRELILSNLVGTDSTPSLTFLGLLEARSGTRWNASLPGLWEDLPETKPRALNPLNPTLVGQTCRFALPCDPRGRAPSRLE